MMRVSDLVGTLERDWYAVLLALAFICAAMAGFDIPW